MMSNSLLKTAGILLLLFLFFADIASAGQANVFVYHRFGDSRYPSTNVDLSVFEAQLRYLQEHQFQVLTLGEIVRHMEQNTLPEKCMAISIDDAYASFMSGGFPLLQKYGMPATLFVSSGTVGSPGYLSWNELKQLQEAGIEIGNHSHAHPFLLNRLADETEAHWRERVRGDIRKAQDLLTEHLGITPTLFAYPYGEYDPQVRDVVREIGFTAAFGQQSGVISSGADLFTLARFPMGGAYATLDGFREKLAMKPLPIEVLSPWTPVLGPAESNPPLLVFNIDPNVVDLRQLRCFVPGQESPPIRAVVDQPGRFEVRAEAPLSGRRSKYTLTAPGRDGRGWYWFSQLWIRPNQVGDEGG